MKLRVCSCALVFALAAQSIVVGEDKAGQLEAIRSALQVLERQVASEKQSAGQPPRVTEIGQSKDPFADAPRPKRLIVRVYDMSDLFAITPAYPAIHQSELEFGNRHFFPGAQGNGGVTGVGGLGGSGLGGGGGFGGGGGGFGGGGGGGGFFSVPESVSPKVRTLNNQFGGSSGDASDGNLAAARTSIEDLINVIQSTISKDQWEDEGGTAVIQRLGASLVISAPEEMHQQITQLVSLLRKRWGTQRTIFVQAYWVWLTERGLNDLLVEPDAGDGSAMVSKDPLATVKPDEWSQLMEELSQPADASIHGGYFAAVTCYNGQTVHTMSNGEQLAVTGMTPVVGGSSAESNIGYHPTTTGILEGASLQLAPLTSANGKYVVLDIHSRVNRIADRRGEDTESAQSRGNPALVTRALDRPVVLSHRLSTTIRVPTNRVTLVGGMTADSVPTQGSAQLYLFVKAGVQELRDDPLDEMEVKKSP